MKNQVVMDKNIIELSMICHKLLLNKCDVITAFRTIYDKVYWDIVPDGKLSQICMDFIDDTQHIPKGDQRKLCSDEFLNKIDEEERNILECYNEEIEEFASELITFLICKKTM